MVGAIRRGISLVEVEIAMAVLAIGLLATVALVARAGALLRRADAEEGAARLAGEVLDSLNQHGLPAPGAFTRGRYTLHWGTSRDSMEVTLVTLVIRYADGDRARADTFTAHSAPWPRTIGHVP